ncbi:MAG: hypothetical protein AAFU34_09455 [Pseudomonadota bacterium]
MVGTTFDGRSLPIVDRKPTLPSAKADAVGDWLLDRPDPTTKIAPDIPALITALSKNDVTWLLAGSYVLALFGADIEPNDLDVVVCRDPENLKRLARCLEELDAVPFWSGDPKWDHGTPDDHAAWRPEPATIEHLDQLFVTRHGMLDIPFALVPDYDTLISQCSQREIAGHMVDICNPRSVLIALEPRQRAKDRARRAIYSDMRKRFGLPPLPE